VVCSAQWPNPKKPPYRCKNLAGISYRSRVIAHFVPDFVAMATGVGEGKMWIAVFDGPTAKTNLSTQKSLTEAELHPFCTKFCCYGNRGRLGKTCFAAFNGPTPKTPYRCKNLTDVFLQKLNYSPYCPRIHCYGIGGQLGKIWFAAFDCSTSKTPIDTKFWQISLTGAEL